MVWVQVPEKESKIQGEEANLPILEEEIPAITGIEAPVVAQHLNANTVKQLESHNWSLPGVHSGKLKNALTMELQL